MGERGIDISEWQAGMDVERVVRENNLSFVMVRTNYGPDHDDALFHKHCDGAERGGAIVTPYVYPLATDTRGSVDDAARIIGGRYSRLIVDWEIGSGGSDHLRAAHERTWEHNLRTPVTYDPAWYHQQVGSPNVDWMGQSGRIGGRWKSWYPDNIPGSFDAILKKLPSSVWSDSRGGIATRIVQFTSSGRLSGWGANLDLNYFPGTRDELAALLGGTQEEDCMGVFDKDSKTAYDEVFHTVVSGEKRDGQINRDLGFIVERVEQEGAATRAAVAAALADPAITAEEMARIVDQAVADHTPTADQVAAAQLPHIQAAVREVLGEDNADQADQFIDALTRRLATTRQES